MSEFRPPQVLEDKTDRYAEGLMVHIKYLHKYLPRMSSSPGTSS